MNEIERDVYIHILSMFRIHGGLYASRIDADIFLRKVFVELVPKFSSRLPNNQIVYTINRLISVLLYANSLHLITLTVGGKLTTYYELTPGGARLLEILEMPSPGREKIEIQGGVAADEL